MAKMTTHLESQPDHGDMHIRKLEDIKPSMRVVKHYPNGNSEEWEILKGPIRYYRITDDVFDSMRDEWCVVVNVKRQHDRRIYEEVKFLADAGIVPYLDGGFASAYLMRVDNG